MKTRIAVVTDGDGCGEACCVGSDNGGGCGDRDQCENIER